MEVTQAQGHKGREEEAERGGGKEAMEAMEAKRANGGKEREAMAMEVKKEPMAVAVERHW